MLGSGVLWIVAGCVLVGCTALGAWIAAQKSRAPTEGALLGFLFGPLGVLVEALLPQGRPVVYEPEGEPAPAFLREIPPAPVQRGWELPSSALKEPPKEEPPPPDLIRW